MDDLVDLLSEPDRRDSNRAWQTEPEVWEPKRRENKEVLVDPHEGVGKITMS